MFDDAVEVIQVHETDVRPDVAQSIIDVSKLYYIKENKLEKARALFEDDTEAFEYMNDRDLNAPRATLHEEREEFDDAAECHLREGNNLKAIELFLLNYQRHQSSHSLLRAATCVLNGLWLYLALWAPEDNWNDETIIILLEHAEVIAPELQDDDLRNEIAMFRALWQSDFATLAHLGELFHARQEHHPAALLCLDHVFAQDFGLASATLSEIALCFQRFLIYARSLSRFSCDPNPCSNPYIQKLFAFRRLNDDSEELFFLPKVSYLYIPAQKILRVEEDTPNFEIHISRWELERLIRAALREVLRDKVWSQNEMCHTMPGLRTCLLFASTQSCPRRQCSQLHIMEAPQEAGTTYNHLVRIHILHIMIFHTLYATEIDYEDLVHQQRAWLRRLYEALYPNHHAIGTLHALSLDAVPELIHGRRIIAVWCQDYLNRLSHDRGATHVFLVNLMRTTRLAMLFDRRVASDSLHRIPCAIRYRANRPLHLLRNGGYFIVHDLLAAMQCGRPDALDRGVLFLNHVLYNRLRVDIGVLLDFMDHLCGSMLIAIYMNMRGTLHGLTLPKSWLTRLVQDVDQLSAMQTDRSTKYVAAGCMGRLLRDVYTGQNAAHLLFETHDLSSPKFNRIRAVFFVKICQNLVYWGYNLPIQELREAIEGTISGFRNVAGGVMSPAVSAYIYARDWQSLARTTLDSMVGTTLDEVVQLQHVSSARSQETSSRVRLVPYTKTEDILPLLDASHIAKLSSSLVDSTEDNTVSTPEVKPRGRDRTKAAADDRAERPEAADSEQIEPIQIEFTEQQMAATSMITKTYRAYVRRKAAEKDPSTEMRRRIYKEFLARSPTIEWRGSPYRFLFLGMVPNLFAVTECLKDHMYRAKATAKESLRNARDTDLEGVDAALDNTSRLFKEACRLHKALVPLATVHKSCDVKKLQEHARAIESLVKHVEDATTADSGTTFLWTKDWRLYKLTCHALE
ncbi:hypothetical protein BD309DRAFT_970099 [Dichomitus squalens]|nr:hypothetical protein BD309DRAFT_970099 [Dichomitus squalens]